ncbi:hypothetical protein C2I36_06665 [Rhodobacteraceae bacterium WD3A24]|nr:hypothetical protein C2I36_06665 [Rhodobacteraceae bacterium WD3A24]
MRHGLVGGLAGIFLAAGLATAAADEGREAATFDVRLLGMSAGWLAISSVSIDGQYAVAARLESGGFLGLLRHVAFEGRARGAAGDDDLRPSRYEARSEMGRSWSHSIIAYDDGVPQLRYHESSRDGQLADIDPGTQGGTVDRATALYLALRDVPRESLCDLDVAMYDGRRRARITLSPGEGAGNPEAARATCRGEYRRLDGVALEEVEDQQEAVRFELSYRAMGDGMMRVTRMQVATGFGTAVLDRRAEVAQR